MAKIKGMSSIIATAVCLFLILNSVSALASVWNSTFDPYKTLSSSDRLGEIGTKTLYYLNDQYQNPHSRSAQLFEGRIRREAEQGEFSLGVDLEGQFSVDHDWYNTFTANEFYFRMEPIWSGATLFMGRKRSHWSVLDDRWKLGVMQPLYKVDSLNPHAQGLTGLFVNFGQSDWNLEFFGTPFFLPDHGPQMETRNGQFVTGHPWVQYPPSEIDIKGAKTKAFYRIDKPSIPDIVVNTGYGLNLQYGQPESTGWLGRVSWAYKPMNQLLLGFDGNLNISAADQLEIDIHPEVGMHEVVALDGSYHSDQWLTYAGMISDNPKNKEFEQPWTYQNYTPSQMWGAGTEWNYKSLRMGLGYLKRLGGENRVTGPRADAASDVLPPRFLFQELVKAEVSYFRSLGAKWGYEVAGEWRTDLKEKSDMISASGSILMGPFWKAYFGTDLLKSSNANHSGSDFIETYETNDRVYGGLQYAF